MAELTGAQVDRWNVCTLREKNGDLKIDTAHVTAAENELSLNFDLAYF